MRLRIAFKLHQDEANLAREIADAAGITTDALGKLALQMYVRSVISRAEEMLAQQAAVTPSVSETVPSLITPEGETNGQPSTADTINVDGTLSSLPDSVPGEATRHP